MLVPQLVALIVSAAAEPATPPTAGPPFAPPEWVRGDAARIKAAPKKLQAACAGEDLAACTDLAYLLATGTKVPADPKRAVDLARSACEKDSARGCALLGYLAHDEPSTFQDPYTSHIAYERACMSGHAAACFHAGLAAERGEGLPAKNPAKARAMFDRSCATGFKGACERKSAAAAGPAGGEDAAPAWGDETACEDAAECVALAYEFLEDGPRKDIDRAAHFFEVGCARGHPFGCGVLGELYEQGLEGLERDPAKALELYERACDRGSRVACARAARRYESGKVARDEKLAVEFGTRACEAGELDGCKVAGHLLLTRDGPRGFSMLSRACHAGHVESCTWSAIAHFEGWGTPKSGPRAIEILRTTCDADAPAGKANACYFLSLFLNESDDPKDRAAAGVAREKACRAGSGPACGVPLERKPRTTE